VHRLGSNPKHSSCLTLVPVRCFKSPEHHLLPSTAKELIQRETFIRVRKRIQRVRVSDRLSDQEVISIQDVITTKPNRSLNDILQVANVPRPVVRLQPR